MKIQDTWLEAQKALKDVVNQIKDEQWDMQVPKEMIRTEKATLREIINYHSYDDAWVPDVLAGKTKEEVGGRYDGDLLKDDPLKNYNNYSDIAADAVAKFDDISKIVHLSYGDWSAEDYLQHTGSFRGFRSWDIAKLIGVDFAMSPELIEGLNEFIAPNVEEWRKMGVFGPEVEVASDADAQTKLLGLVGRKV
jgi:uncharacterized protein (TIGR03086 family)